MILTAQTHGTYPRNIKTLMISSGKSKSIASVSVGTDFGVRLPTLVAARDIISKNHFPKPNATPSQKAALTSRWRGRRLSVMRLAIPIATKVSRPCSVGSGNAAMKVCEAKPLRLVTRTRLSTDILLVRGHSVSYDCLRCYPVLRVTLLLWHSVGGGLCLQQSIWVTVQA